MAAKQKGKGSEEKSSSTENMVFVGKKPTMSYVLACVMQLSQGANEVRVVARGRAISKAVDVVEIVRQRFMPDSVKLGEIKIGTEIIGSGDDQRNVSTIEIELKKV
ncbi:MAG: DNA-binding protein Alba [Candidatus Freyarchaeota archaeon]|nr:DNA-binding protein Alba [Candidatus Jordarchaeia archaeon]